MSVPTITSITPTVGHTGGRTLAEIVGTGFALPADPPPVGTGPVPEPPPSVQVTIGGTPCSTVWVYSDTLLRVLTPIHDPSGIPAGATTAAIAASDVVVQNLDGDSVAIPGESATLVEAFSFHRPNLSAMSFTARVLQAFILELQRQILPNVQFNPHTDFDDTTGDALINMAAFATLPGIAIVDLKLPRAQVRRRETQEVQIDATSYLLRRAPMFRDAVMILVGVSDNQDELITLEEVVDGFFQKNTRLAVQRDAADASRGFADFQLDYGAGEDVVFSPRGEGNVVWFSAPCAIREIPRQDIPGLPMASVPGAPTSLPAEATLELGYTFDELTLTAEHK